MTSSLRGRFDILRSKGSTRPRVRDFNSARGASIIEVTLSLALASAIFAAAIPSLYHIGSRQKVLNEATRVSSALEEAYLSALTHDSTVIASFIENHLDLSFGQAPRFLHLTPPPGVILRLQSSEQKQITFYPTHTATPATVLVQNGDFSCSLVVSLRGRIRRACA